MHHEAQILPNGRLLGIFDGFLWSILPINWVYCNKAVLNMTSVTKARVEAYQSCAVHCLASTCLGVTLEGAQAYGEPRNKCMYHHALNSASMLVVLGRL